MNSIQIGVDLATSVSVIGAAIAFIYNQASESRRAKTVEARRYKNEIIFRACDTLRQRILEGMTLAAAIRRSAKSAGGEKIDSNDLIEFCNRFIFDARITISISAALTESQKSTLEHMISDCLAWGKAFRDANVDATQPVPNFDALINTLLTRVAELGASIISIGDD